LITVLKDNKMSLKRKRLIYIIVYMAYTSIYISRVNMSVAETALEALSIFDAAGYGLIGGLFSCIYSVGRLVNGRIGDKTPPWIMLTIGLGVAGLANITIGFLPPYLAILLLWCTNAYAQSMLWSSVLAVVSSIYRGPYLKRMTSLMVTAVATGNIVAVLLGGFLITYLGVSFAFVIPGALNIILGVFVFFATRKVHPEDEVEDKSSHASMLSLLKNRDVLLMSIPSVCHGIMKENVTIRMVAYSVATFGVTLDGSGFYLLLIPVIGLILRLMYLVFSLNIALDFRITFIYNKCINNC